MKRSGNSSSSNYQQRQKQLIQECLLEAAERCIEAKDRNDGKLPHGCMKRVLADIGCPELNRDKVNYKISQLEEDRKKCAPTTPNGHVAVVDDLSTTNISQLTSPSIMSQLTEESEVSSGRNKGGRPKKLIETIIEEPIKDRVAAATTQAATELKRLLDTTAKYPGKRLKKGTVGEIIEDAKAKYNIPDDVSISKRTIRSRVKRNNTKGECEATTTPMLDVEEVLLRFCLILDSMNQSLDKGAFLQLANSLIKGSETEKKVINTGSMSL